MRDQKECSTSDESGSVEFQTVKRWVAASALPVNSIERNRKANPIQRLDCGRKEILCYGNGRDFEDSMKTMTRGHASPAREESLIRSGRADRGSRRAKDRSQFCSCREHHGSTRNRKFPKKLKIKGKKPPRVGPKGEDVGNSVASWRDAFAAKTPFPSGLLLNSLAAARKAASTGPSTDRTISGKSSRFPPIPASGSESLPPGPHRMAMAYVSCDMHLCRIALPAR